MKSPTVRERTARCEYLFNKAASEIKNPEQQEAYIARLDQHWQKLLDLFKVEIANAAADLRDR